MMFRLKASCVVVAVALMSVPVYGAVNVDWASSGGTSWLYDDSGDWCGNVTDNWLVELVIDEGNNNVWNTVLNNYLTGTWGFGTYSDTDSLAASTAWSSASSGFNRSDNIGDANAGKTLYMIFYNDPVRANATEIGIVYDSTGAQWVAPAIDTPMGAPHEMFDASPITGTQDNDTFGTPAAAARWYTVAVVPEPGTMALFAIGTLIGGLRMRKRKNA